MTTVSGVKERVRWSSPRRRGLGVPSWLVSSRGHVVTVLCAIPIVAALAMAAVPSLLAPDNPDVADFLHPYAMPSSSHLFGTDRLGRDLFSRWIYGVRPPLLGSLLIVAVTIVVATLAAIAMAWYGRWVDESLARLLDIVFAFPGIVLAILAISLFGNGLWPAAIALSIAHIPYTTRVLRSVALRERRLSYVEALELQGVSRSTIWGRHLLRNLLPHVAGQALLTFAGAFVALTAISFIGLGVNPPTADWGKMVADGQSALLGGHAGEAIIAGVSIVVLVTAVNVLGERLLGRGDER